MPRGTRRESVQLEAEEKSLVDRWIKVQLSESTKNVYRNNIEVFRLWFGKTLTEFLQLSVRDMRESVLRFQDDLKQKAVPNNTIISFLTAVTSFCTWNDKPLHVGRKMVHYEIDLSSHTFNNGDLSKMFDVANVEQKAILASFVSLGWEVSAILNDLSLEYVKALIQRAGEEKRQFVFFQSQRHKTGALRLGVLNPLALEWLEKWTQDSRCLGPKLFTYTTKEGVNKMLKHLARDAHITKLGRIHTHGLRKWVMDGLSAARWNEFQIKYVVGKRIPVSDATYLLTLKQQVSDMYPEAYEKFLNIRPAKVVTVIDEEKTRQIADLQRQVAQLKEYIDHVVAEIKKGLRPIV